MSMWAGFVAEGVVLSGDMAVHFWSWDTNSHLTASDNEMVSWQERLAHAREMFFFF